MSVWPSGHKQKKPRMHQYAARHQMQANPEKISIGFKNVNKAKSDLMIKGETELNHPSPLSQ